MELEEGAWNARSNVGKRKQVLATIIANLSSLTVGVMVRVAIYNSEINRDILSCLPTGIAIILGIFFSYLSCECYGRKNTLCLSMIPFIFCLVLIIFFEKPVWMRIALCIEMFGSAMWTLTLPVYVSEISCNSKRGVLVCIRVIFILIGRRIAELMTLQWTVQQVTPVLILFPLIALIGMYWLPESPIFLVKASRIDEATRSLLWLRDNDEEYVQNELLGIKQTVQGMPNSGSCLRDGIETLQDLFGVSANRRSLFIAVGVLSGVLLIRWNGYPWRFNLVIRYDDATNLVTAAIIPLLGSALAVILMDLSGRRTLLLISCVMVLLECIIHLCKEGFATGEVDNVTTWVLYAVNCVTSTAYYLGMRTLPTVIVIEVFPRKILAMGYMISLVIPWILGLIYIWIYMSPIVEGKLVERLCQLVLCVCWLFFIYFYVPETKKQVVK